MALAVGTHFGPYDVLGSLGAGGMGEVYRARDTRLKREVALNGRWQVSTDGGVRPVWSKSSGELFFVSPAGAIMGVGVERAASWVAATPTPVIEPGHLTTSPNFGAMFDVTPDGQRFVMIKQHEATPETAPPVSVVVVQHWAEELKRLAPAGR